MATTPRLRGLRAGIARLAAAMLGRCRPAAAGEVGDDTQGHVQGAAQRHVEPPDPRLPEQRLLDVATRHRRLAQTSSSVKTVLPTEPADGVGPAWVRRLDDKMVVMPKLPDDDPTDRHAEGVTDRQRPDGRRRSRPG